MYVIWVNNEHKWKFTLKQICFISKNTWLVVICPTALRVLMQAVLSFNET